MDVNTIYPSTYLKAADLQKRPVTVTMDRIEMETIGRGDTKPVLYFKGKERGLVLNKTNANAIAYLYGANTDQWAGRAIELYPTLADYQGRPVEAIRVRPPSNTAQKQNAPPPREEPPPPSPDDYGADLNDDVPF